MHVGRYMYMSALTISKAYFLVDVQHLKWGDGLVISVILVYHYQVTKQNHGNLAWNKSMVEWEIKTKP